MKKNALYAQSGGVTAVINATAGALILEAKKVIKLEKFLLLKMVFWELSEKTLSTHQKNQKILFYLLDIGQVVSLVLADLN